MGNSSSSAKKRRHSTAYPSDGWDQGVRRSVSLSNAPTDKRSSSPTTFNGFLDVPGSHRRTRSAHVGRSSSPNSEAPPAYTPPIPSKEFASSSSPQSEGSIFTRVVQPRPQSSCSQKPRSNSYLNKPMRKETREDALDMLRQFDTVLLVDDSSSMRGSKWDEAMHALSELASEAGNYDADGIDLYFLNSSVEGKGLKDRTRVEALFRRVQPTGITPIGGSLEKLMKPYLDRLERSNNPSAIKPINYIVITDGAPTDDPESVIRATAARLDKNNWPLSQLGIQFVQIGNSRSATNYLKGLDDDLDGVRDIVDTTPYTGQDLTASTLIKILLGGINRRVDKKGGQILLNSD